MIILNKLIILLQSPKEDSTFVRKKVIYFLYLVDTLGKINTPTTNYRYHVF